MMYNRTNTIVQEGYAIMQMQTVLSQAYQTLKSLFSSDQSVHIIIAEILAIYFKDTMTHASFEYTGSRGILRHGILNRLIAEVDAYDIKEAVCMLDELIDWSYIENYETAGALLREVEGILDQNVFQTGENAADGIQEILDIAGVEGPIVSTPMDICLLIGKQWFPSCYKIAEFCCGGGRIGSEIVKYWGKEKETIEYYGEDIDSFCCICTRIVMWLMGIKSIQVKNRNSLIFDETTQKEQFDLIVADLPTGKNWSLKVDNHDRRLDNVQLKNIYSEWMFLEDVLYRMSKTGKAFILTTRGALVRKNERELRRMVVENDWLDAVITLPRNLYPNHSMGRELLVFDKDKWRTGKVVFADISHHKYREGRNRCRIQSYAWGEVFTLLSVINEVLEDDKDRVIVDTQTIIECGDTWNPREYIDRKYEPEIIKSGIVLDEVAVVTRGIQILKEEERELRQDGTHYFLNIKNIEDGRIRYDECEKIREKKAAWEEKYKIREDDIIVTTKGTLIKMALVPQNPPPSYISGNLTIIRVNQKKYHPYVLYEFLQSETGRKNLERIQTGTTIKLINSSSLEQLRIPSYPMTALLETGNLLKQNELNYQKQKQDLQMQYERSKKELMEGLKVEDEENIY